MIPAFKDQIIFELIPKQVAGQTTCSKSDNLHWNEKQVPTKAYYNVILRTDS